MTGLLGWALGGFAFGIIGDYFGRVRVLMLSVVLVAVCTALQGFTHSTLTFGICRFMTGVGTGAEVVLGIPLVAEAFADVHRAKVLGIMMTGGGFGSLIGGQLFAYHWAVWLALRDVRRACCRRLILVLLRRGLEEPEHFQAVHARRKAIRAQREQSQDDQEYMRFAPAQLFTPALRYSTFIGVLFCVGTLLSIWTSADLAADDPGAVAGAARHHRAGGGAVHRARHDAVGTGRHHRLRDVRLHRRRGRPARDDHLLQCRRHRGRAVYVSMGRYV